MGVAGGIGVGVEDGGGVGVFEPLLEAGAERTPGEEPEEDPDDEVGTAKTCLQAVFGHCTFLPAALSGTCIDFWQCGQRRIMFCAMEFSSQLPVVRNQWSAIARRSLAADH